MYEESDQRVGCNMHKDQVADEMLEFFAAVSLHSQGDSNRSL